jgi:acetyl esterase/lipase
MANPVDQSPTPSARGFRISRIKTMTRHIAPLFLVVFLAATRLAAEERVIPLYDGPAPGSENWTHQEKDLEFGFIPGRVISNVVKPTLTVIQPEASAATGAAVVICPGGGFHILSFDNEGVYVAQWLATKGVASFVLKYRLVETKTDNAFLEMGQNLQNFERAVAPTAKLATADALAAIDYARKHAAEFGLKPDRIGIMGFSAGGMIAADAACSATKETRPDFVAPIYAVWGEGAGQPSADAPPLFVVGATDDQLDLAKDSVRLYQQWLAVGRPAELHMYAAGGHGFGMRKQSLPVDGWAERFAEWLAQQGMLEK